MDRSLSERVDRMLEKFDAVLGRLSPDPDRSLTTEEAAVFLGVHRTTLLRFTQAGSLPFIRLGKTFTYTRADLIEFRDRYRTQSRFLGKLITQGKP